MYHEHLYQVGTILKAKGLKGAVKVSFEAFFLEYLSENALPDHLYMSLKKAEPIPFFIEEMEVGSHEITIKFEDTTTRNEAEQLRGATLFFEKDKVADYVAEMEDEGWEFLVGYTVIDSHDVVLGVIEEIFYFNSNDLAKIIHNGHEVLIPLHEDLVELLDEAQKIIVMDLPDGLLDLS